MIAHSTIISGSAKVPMVEEVQRASAPDNSHAPEHISCMSTTQPPNGQFEPFPYYAPYHTEHPQRTAHARHTHGTTQTQPTHAEMMAHNAAGLGRHARLTSPLSSPPTTTWLSEAGPHARGASGSKGAGRTLVRTPWAPHVLAGSWPI